MFSDMAATSHVEGQTEKPAQPHRPNRFFTLLFSAWAAWLLCYPPFLFFCAPQNNDQSWYMYAAQRMIGGAQLYGSQIVGGWIADRTSRQIFSWGFLRQTL
jgi:hypothetical protein